MKLSRFTPRACAAATLATLAGMPLLAQAQFEYTAQSRGAQVVANVLSTTVVPSTDPYGGPPNYVTVGDSKASFSMADASNFGEFNSDITATAKYLDAQMTASESMRSNLAADRITFSSVSTLASVGGYAAIDGGADIAAASFAVDFNVAHATDVLVDWSSQLVLTESGDPSRKLLSLTLTGPDGVMQYLQPGQLRLTLGPGRYYLGAQSELLRPVTANYLADGVLTSKLTVQAVPEASTLSLMGLGLLAGAVVAKRRRALPAQA